MSSKVKRKVTVENTKEGDDQPRRPSVFERLGPNAVNVAAQPSERHTRPEQNEKCRNWLRSGSCIYGNTCRFKHDPFPASSRRAPKPEKDMEDKDLRHRVWTKRDEPKGSRTGSLSPKRIGKRSSSRSRKGEHESKIKSTVVVTRPRSPAASTEPTESKKKSEGNWEDDSDDWPMDAAQLDFKEELTLERKRQQLQRELALELQKERLLNENVTITKTVSFSESSSTSSSSDSGSISSSSGSSSSSSDDDTDSSSSSSSSSSSGSRPPAKRRNKKSTKDEKPSESKGKEDYDKVKSGRSKSQKMRSPSPILEGRVSKKNRDKRKGTSQSPKRRLIDGRNSGDGRSNLNVRIRGPRTPPRGPSPVGSSRKQRQWAQSSSTDSRSADVQKNRGKRHKKKRDASRGDKYKSDRGPTPPPLSSPNRTALMPSISMKKSKQRDESGGKSRHRGRDSSPMLLPRNTIASTASVPLLGKSQRFLSEEKAAEKHRVDDRSKFYSRKDGDDMLPMHKRTESRDRTGKRNRASSPRKDSRRGSLSPVRDRYDSEVVPGVKKLYPEVSHKDSKGDRRQASDSPVRGDRRKVSGDADKKREVRDLSPRMHDSRRDTQYRAGEPHYDKRGDQKSKRLLSPELKKRRDDKNRDYPKDRNADFESTSWSADHRKSTSSTGRRTPEPRGRQELRSQPSSSQGDRSRDRDQDRKKRKERDLSARSEDSERTRLPSPRRSQSPLHGHHGVREIEPLTGNRGGRIYDADVPPGEREYAYGYDPLHDPYMSERLLPPDYDSDVMRVPSLYPPDVYPESRYRREGKEPAALIDRYGARDVLSPREILPHRDIISLTGRPDDYIAELPIEERGYEERWSRGRGRDDWDAYAAIPPAPLPPHVAAALDEDRYGMPRRRRASPEWQRGRLDERETAIGGHRQIARSQLPQDVRSRSPPKGTGANRGSWGDRGGRHESRSDNRHDDSQKGVEDRKGRNVRKDRGKRKEDLSLDSKSSNLPKDKPGKRPHSASPPPKDAKRRRDDTGTPENVILSEKAVSYKRLNDELKGESKSSLGRTKKASKIDTASPRSDASHSSLLPTEKVDAPKSSEGKSKEDRKSKHDAVRGDDDFSDWSDGDDDLLMRDDFIDSEGTNDNSRTRHRSGDKNQEDSGSLGSRRKERPAKDQQAKKIKEANSRSSSRNRSNEEVSHGKDSKPVVDAKDVDAPETFSLKDDTVTDVDEYITAESVDYDPISDDELDALIEEPEELTPKLQTEGEKSKIVDALDVNWSALMNESKTEFKPANGRKRFKAAHVLSRIGFSQVFAGPQLSEKIISECQKQLDEENDENKEQNSEEAKKKNKFVMEHQIAAFHVAISQTKKERVNAFSQVGPYRRALCARRDLQIRNLLCKPVNKLAPTSAVSYSPQYSVVDKDLYKQSLEFLRRKSPVGTQPQTVNVC